MKEDLRSRIEAVLDEKVRPVLSQDGGDIAIHDLQDGELQVRLLGQCSNCPSASATMDGIVRSAILGQVEGVTDVKLVQGVVSDDLIDFALQLLHHEK